jgi:chromate transport protein ChrA
VSQHHPLPPGIGPARINGAPRQSKQHGDAGMMILAKIVYWLMSILAALLLALTAVLLVDIAYGEEMPDWWLHALSLALLAICAWFVGRLFRYFVRRISGSTTAPSI